MNETTIDHKQLLAGLSDEDRVSLTEKSDRQGLFNLAAHILAMVVSGSWIFLGMWGWQFVMLLHGIQIIFLFTLLHETVHFTPFESAWINRVVGWVSGFLIFIPPLWFRYFHLAHHRYTHDPEKDPELENPQVTSFRRYVWLVTGIPVWCSQFKTLLSNAIGNFDYAYLPSPVKNRVIWEARAMIGLYAVISAGSYAVGSSVLLYLWILPAVLGQPFLRLYLMAEHGRCPHVANMLENTRTTYTTRIVRWLAWNMPFHIEHHAYPAVPYYKLPEFHQYTRSHISVEEGGYSAFHRETVSEIAG
ncbi:MAG: fatty acid desaturase [Rhizobiaceae bacterium]